MGLQLCLTVCNVFFSESFFWAAKAEELRKRSYKLFQLLVTIRFEGEKDTV